MSRNLVPVGSPAPRPRAHYLVRGRVAPELVARHALSPEDAVAFAPADPKVRRELARMVENGSARLVAGGRVWFDMDAYEAAAAARTRQLLPLFVGVSLIAAALAAYFYAGASWR